MWKYRKQRKGTVWLQSKNCFYDLKYVKTMNIKYYSFWDSHSSELSG